MPSKNTSPPRCKLCGHEHWDREPHVFDGPKQPLVAKPEGPQGALNVIEAELLAKCEAVIANGLAQFIIVGNALAEIRDNRLYRATHKSFDAYATDRWGFDRRRAGGFITAAKVSEISDSFGLPTPKNEAIAHELAPLAAEPEKLAATYSNVLEHAESEGRPVTATLVRQAVRPEAEPREVCPTCGRPL